MKNTTALFTFALCVGTALFAADSSRVPEPKPVKGPVEVHAFYYPGTEQMAEWDQVDQTLPHIKPLLGWYDEGNPEVVDWQIKWAAEHGISAFCVDWYWNRGDQRLNHWVDAFYKAGHRKYLKWYMMYANHNEPGAHSTEDQVRVTRYWIDNFFKTPEYYKIDGKPVVVYWSFDSLDADFRAEMERKGQHPKYGDGARYALALTDRMAREAGLPGVYFIDMYHGWAYMQDRIDRAKNAGYEAQMIYNFDSISARMAPEALNPGDTQKLFTYDAVVEAVPKWWEMTSRDPSFPFWPIIPTGWNDIPRSFEQSRVIYGRSVEKFRKICADCRAFCERKGFKRVIIAPLNEWQEGSYIEPNEEFGFGMYDAIRDAFCDKPAEGWPKNVLPKDVGCGPYDYPPMPHLARTSWDFDDGTVQGWYRNPYGTAYLRNHDGKLWFFRSFKKRSPAIRTRLQPFQAEKYVGLRVKMRLVPGKSKKVQPKGDEKLTLWWGTRKTPVFSAKGEKPGPGGVVLPAITRENRASTPVKVDGQWHEYTLNLLGHPGWKGMVDEVWFDPVELHFTDVLIDSISLISRDTDQARIDEIAQWLPEAPRADGAPASDRAAWDRLAQMPQGSNVVAAAEKLLDKPVPDVPDELYLEFSQNGNRTHYQSANGKRMNFASTLFLAECLEHKGRFIPKLVEAVDALCAQRSWTLPAHDGDLTCFNGKPHIDLMSGAISLQLAYTSAWLGDSLPEATRAKIYSEIDRRTFKPYLDTSRSNGKPIPRHWWYRGGNNWNSVCHCCCVRAALALIPDRRLRAEFVESAERTVPYALRGYTDDGYCSEGMGYWNYGYGHHIMMGLSVRAATGGKVDLFADPKCREVMKYAYGYQVLPGKSPHFADGGGNPSAVFRAMGRQIWPDLADTPSLSCSVLSGGFSSISLRAFGQEPAPVKPLLDELPARTWFPDAQVALCRARYPKVTKTFAIAFKGGHNAELHNHNDVGSYYILLDGSEMAGDPGGEIYTRRTFSRERYQSKVLNSYGHPVPVVGGKLQKGGRKAAAKVLRADFTDAKDVVEIDYTAAYDVPALKSLVRTMTFDREACAITITDRVAFSEPTAFEVPVITYREWEADADFTSFSFKKSPKTYRRMKMDVQSSAPVKFTKELIENPDRPSPQRLAFAFAEPVSEAVFTTVFSAR